jgi:hypothetical protein
MPPLGWRVVGQGNPVETWSFALTVQSWTSLEKPHSTWKREMP